ncbi:hypothetical protein [Aeromonas media]|uniref:hypothetical protein n=1 Tax=Aeromonas media TaxID=651 RepID=UPI0011165E69|nr:hypothetical protein [Aeromonas media]
MSHILEFFLPIYFFALTGTYALLQNLQALGVASIWHGPFIDLQGTVKILSGAYFLFILLVFLVNIVAATALSSRLSVFLVAAWLFPCLLHSFGVYSFIPVIPERYTIGSGGPDQLGLPEGALINAIVVVVLSWSIATISLHVTKAKKKFKSFFDHIWYLFGLSAIVFYVSDQGSVGPSIELAHSKKVLESSFERIDGELRRLNSKCNNELSSRYQSLCSWSGDALLYIERFGNKNDVEITLSPAPTIEDIFMYAEKKGINSEDIKGEIAQYNIEECKISPYCSSLGIELNSHPGLIEGDVGLYSRYALSVEAIMPTITRHWKIMISTKEKMEENQQKENRRWVVLVFVFSVLIGVKVANSSRELFGGRESSFYRVGTSKAFEKIYGLLLLIFGLFHNFFNKALQRTSR